LRVGGWDLSERARGNIKGGIHSPPRRRGGHSFISHPNASTKGLRMMRAAQYFVDSKLDGGSGSFRRIHDDEDEQPLKSET